MAAVDVATQINVGLGVDGAPRPPRSRAPFDPNTPTAYRKQLSESLGSDEPLSAPARESAPAETANENDAGESQSVSKSKNSPLRKRRQESQADDPSAMQARPLDGPNVDGNGSRVENGAPVDQAASDPASTIVPAPNEPAEPARMPRGLQNLLDEMSQGIAAETPLATVVVVPTGAIVPPAGLFAELSALGPIVEPSSADRPAPAEAGASLAAPPSGSTSNVTVTQLAPAPAEGGLSALPLEAAEEMTGQNGAPSASPHVAPGDQPTAVPVPKSQNQDAGVPSVHEPAAAPDAQTSRRVELPDTDLRPRKPIVAGSDTVDAGTNTAERFGEAVDRPAKPATVPATAGATLVPADEQNIAAAADESPEKSNTLANEADVSDNLGVAGKKYGAESAPLHQDAARSGVARTTSSLDVTRPDFPDRLASAMQSAGHDGRAMRIRLHPPELGALQIEVSLRDGVMSARLDVQSVAVQHAILDSLSLLREALAHQGTQIDRIDVQIAQSIHEDAQPDLSGDDHFADQQAQDEGRGEHGDDSPENSETEQPAERKAFADRLDVEI
jgi:flagellar hook-length control protein FliK